MYIQVIDELSDFDTLRGNWDAVYAADPEAQFFLSWQWLSDWLSVNRTIWFVLAAKPTEADSEYVAFLPLRMRTDFDKKHGFYNEIFFGGAGFSDYTGILSLPEFEAEAVAAFADHLKRKVHWGCFSMDNLMMSDQRRRLFLRAFDKMRFVHTPIDYKNPNDPTDHGICPSINLPGDWDEYLSTLSTNNRQKIRRLLKKVDASKDLGITLSEATDFDIVKLLEFWKIKWAPLKGGDRANHLADLNYQMLTRCARNGNLILPVFRHGNRQVAAIAILVDHCKKSLLFFIAGRDETYHAMPTGYLLHAYSIRHAITHGFRTYDFLKGNEPYKFLFGPQRVRRQRALTVTTKNNRNLGDRLDPRGLPAMLGMTLEFEDQDDPHDAELGYRQILEIEPNHALALYRFGRLMAKNGAHARAKELLSRSVEIEPGGDNAWFCLGQSLQSLGDNEAALDAYRRVVKIQPENEEAKKLIVQLSTDEPATRPVLAAVRPGTPKPAPATHRTLAAAGADWTLQDEVREIRKQMDDYFDWFVAGRGQNGLLRR